LGSFGYVLGQLWLTSKALVKNGEGLMTTSSECQ